jgi:hypothetical protein
MTRVKAAGIHLAISALIGAIVLSLIIFVWYPSPFFKAAGGPVLGTIIVAVDVILGPFLTLLVFRAGKPGLKGDLLTIAGLQVIALCYGLHTMWQARPAFIVVMTNYAVAVPANHLEPDELAQAKFAEFQKLPNFGPILVGATTRNADEDFEVNATAMAGGKDLFHRPAFFLPIEQFFAHPRVRLKTLNTLIERRFPERSEELKTRFGQSLDDLIFVPLRARAERDDVALVFDKQGKLLGHLDVDPWLN